MNSCHTERRNVTTDEMWQRAQKHKNYCIKLKRLKSDDKLKEVLFAKVNSFDVSAFASVYFAFFFAFYFLFRNWKQQKESGYIWYAKEVTQRRSEEKGKEKENEKEEIERKCERDEEGKMT